MKKLEVFLNEKEEEMWKTFIKYNKKKYIFLLLIGFFFGFNIGILLGVI